MQTYLVTLHNGDQAKFAADNVLLGQVGELILTRKNEGPLSADGTPYGIAVDPRPRVILALAPGQWLKIQEVSNAALSDLAQ